MGFISSLKEAFGFAPPAVPPNHNKSPNTTVPVEWEKLLENKLSTATFTLVPFEEKFHLDKLFIENEFWESRIGILTAQGLIDKRMYKHDFITKPVALVLNTKTSNKANSILVKIAGEEIGYISAQDAAYARYILEHGEIKYFSSSIQGGPYKRVSSAGTTTKGYASYVVKVKIGFVKRFEVKDDGLYPNPPQKKQIIGHSDNGGITVTYVADPPKESKAVKKEKKRLSQCPYDFVIIDFETTGFVAPAPNRARYDEILSVSIIDQDGNVLLDTLCRPQHRKSWAKATEYNGITPEMVKGKPTFEEVFPKVKNILLQAKYVLAYNIKFEYDFLTSFDYLFCFPGNTKLCDLLVFGPDPMLMYQAFERPDNSYSLISAAAMFGFEFQPHESLEDVKATLYVYKKMLEAVSATPDEAYLIDRGYDYKCGANKATWLDPLTCEIIDESLIK